MNDPYEPTTVIHALSLARLYPNVYFLGPTATRVSFASQQRRALNLVWALNETRKLSELTVGVVGGGLAGLTAAAAAISCGADVWLFEAQPQLCPAQRETEIRYIHPTINFWPQEPLASITHWPFLNWYAASAREVIDTVEEQWTREFANAARVELGARVHGLSCASGEVELSYGSGAAKKSFDLVIIAVGFGVEEGLKGIEADSYWNNNSILRNKITSDRRVWLSGVGDGGLIDCLRLCYARFDRGRLLLQAAMDLDSLREVITKIEKQAEQCEDAKERTEGLEKAYKELAERGHVARALEDALARSDIAPMGYIVHRLETPFDHRTAPIHRVLFAMALVKKLIEPCRGEIAVDDHGPLLVLHDRSTRRIQASQLILRHGAASALTGLISDEGIGELKSDAYRRHQDALLTPRWPDLYFEKQHSAKFRSGLFKPREFAEFAREFLQKALNADGIYGNVGIAKPAQEYELLVKVAEADSGRLKRVPEHALGLHVRILVEDTIVLFEEEEEMEPDDTRLFPGTLVTFGDLSADSAWYPVTCLVTDQDARDIVGLCVLHELVTEAGEPVYVRRQRKDSLAGHVRRSMHFDGQLLPGGREVACVLFDLRGSVSFQPAPDGERLSGTIRNPLDLFDRSGQPTVRKWGAGGEFGEGNVVSVDGMARVHTNSGLTVFSNVICVQGEERFSQPGDSGSLVVTHDGEAVGVIFAGSEHLTYLLPITRILESLEVDLLLSKDEGPVDLSPMMELGWLRLDQGRPKEAGALFQQVMTRLRARPNADPMELSFALQGRAAAFSRLGRAKDAQPLLREAVELRMTHAGASNPQVASALQALGYAHADQGQFEEAEGAFRKAYAIRVQAQGEGSLEVAATLHGLGSTLRRAARLDEAEQALGKALAIRQARLGSDHRETAETFIELGWLAFARREDEKARGHFQRALSILERIPASEGALAAALQGLGALSTREGHAEVAESLLRRTLGLRLKQLGERHPQVAVTLHALANACADQAKLTEAEGFLRNALDIREKTQGPEHPLTAATLRTLGWVLRRQRRFDEALPLLQRSLGIRERALGPRHEDTVDSILELGWLAIDQGRLDDAESLFRRAITETEAVQEVRHAFATAQLGLAGVLSRQGRPAEAAGLLANALALREQVFGETHPAVGSVLQALGYAYGDQGDFAEAERLFRRAVEIRRSVNGPNHPDTGSAMKGLGWALRRQQRFDEAAQVLEQIVGNAGAQR